MKKELKASAIPEEYKGYAIRYIKKPMILAVPKEAQGLVHFTQRFVPLAVSVREMKKLIDERPLPRPIVLKNGFNKFEESDLTISNLSFANRVRLLLGKTLKNMSGTSHFKRATINGGKNK